MTCNFTWLDENYTRYLFQSTTGPFYTETRSHSVFIGNIGTNFPSGTETGMNSFQYKSYQLLSCEQIESHKREPGWTHTCITVILFSCGHPLALPTFSEVLEWLPKFKQKWTNYQPAFNFLFSPFNTPCTGSWSFANSLVSLTVITWLKRTTDQVTANSSAVHRPGI